MKVRTVSESEVALFYRPVSQAAGVRYTVVARGSMKDRKFYPVYPGTQETASRILPVGVNQSPRVRAADS